MPEPTNIHQEARSLLCARLRLDDFDAVPGLSPVWDERYSQLGRGRPGTDVGVASTPNLQIACVARTPGVFVQGAATGGAAVERFGTPMTSGVSRRFLRMRDASAREGVLRTWSRWNSSTQTRSMIQTDQKAPSVSSQTKGVLVNADGSVDVSFGPTAPPGKEKNWVQTVPGKGWNVILRLYGPLAPWFDRTWRPGEIGPQP